MNFRSPKPADKWSRFLDFKLCSSNLQQVLYGRPDCAELRPTGSMVSLHSLRQGQVLLSHKLNSNETVGLHSAFVFKSSEFSCTYPLFFACLVSMEIQVSLKKEAEMHPAHRQRVLFLESVELWTYPKMSVWTGPERESKDTDGRCKPNCFLELHIRIGYRSPALYREYKVHLGEHWSRQKEGYKMKQYCKHGFVASINACVIGSWEIQRHGFNKSYGEHQSANHILYTQLHKDFSLIWIVIFFSGTDALLKHSLKIRYEKT